jgi:hypothetical protein
MKMESTRNNLVLPIIGALLAAVVGGIVWAVIAVVTDYEIGIVAWAIGGAAGFLVSFFAKGNVTSVHQIIAVIGSLIGIILGKYFILGYYYDYSISGIFNSETFSLFFSNFSVLFSGMDLVFVLLAVATAWQLPAKLAPKEPVSEKSVESAAE